MIILEYMFDLSKLQILSIAGFILILISIPISFSLVKRTQTLNSQASQPNTQKNSTQNIKPVTKPKTSPTSSPLSDLEKMLGGVPPATPSATPSAPPEKTTPTPTVSLGFGPLLNFTVNLEGKPQDDQSAKIFVGIAPGNIITSPKYTLTYTVNTNDAGTFGGISLAGLNPGSVYTAYLKGPSQIDEASTFTMSPTETNLNNNQALTLLSGDLNEDNTINSADYTIAKNLYNTTSGSPNWNERADFNGDEMVNGLDLSYILKNFGKTGKSGIWYSPPPTASGSATLGSGGPSGGYWLWVPPQSAIDN